MWCLMKDKEILGIDIENPWKYYGTCRIEDIPIHLRKRARECLKK